MRPQSDLPLDSSWQSTDDYVSNLLNFVSTSELFRNLCGGVHVLDFLTRKPDLYSWVLPEEWRQWFEHVEVDDVLDLLLRKDFESLATTSTCSSQPNPPKSLVSYVQAIRRLSLRRDFCARKGRQDLESLPRHVAVGMKPKKIHEVGQFAAYVDDLAEYLANNSIALDGTQDLKDPAVVDFGSGQNYLGRTLACPPHNKLVYAIEQRHHNVEGAKGMDVSAKLLKKQKNIVNKKEWKQKWEASRQRTPKVADSSVEAGTLEGIDAEELQDLIDRMPPMLSTQDTSRAVTALVDKETSRPLASDEPDRSATLVSVEEPKSSNDDRHPDATGRVLHIEKELSSGDLSEVLDAKAPPAIVVSIHSCGNLTHHGLRSLTLNPSVKAVALVGCCYNLLTERLGPPTFKLPSLRSNHPRLEATSSAFDPHGFPMSKRLEEYEYPVPVSKVDAPSQLESSNGKKYYNLNGEVQEIDCTGKGVRLNITARMMAVQAPHNWGPEDSKDFFQRHYFRALLQRILLDLDIVKMSSAEATPEIEITGGTLSGKDESGSPLIIGSLRKACFVNFEAYVRGAVAKLAKDPTDGEMIHRKTQVLLENDGELIRKYESDYLYAKKRLSIIWSLMAFSASVIESTILVDRWLWLKEQESVQDAWIESVFDYRQSPRNMVVVGVKKAAD